MLNDLFSSMSVPNEVLLHRSPKFSTRHTATGILTHIDGSSVSAFGYLPQDIIGKQIMDFYHPEDLVFLKDVYEMVMKKGQIAGSSFCSRPYRFLIKNGCYITLKTKWTSFVNPWSRKLEFVIGNHRVLQGTLSATLSVNYLHHQPFILGPKHCDIFSTVANYSCKFSDELLANGKRLKEDIIKLLSEPVSRPSNTVKEQVTKRCQALASFMETLIGDVTYQKDLKLDLPAESEWTASERDSVMLGEISPHHDYYDSKSSSETPPTYNQLNYKENLCRFFNSKPTTIGTDESMKIGSDNPDSSVCEPSSLSPGQKCFEESGGSGSGWACNSSNESNVHMDSITNTSKTSSSTSTAGRCQQPTSLTEAMINKHNDAMGKFMLKKHKEARCSERIAADKSKKGFEKNQECNAQAHGMKRSSSLSWSGEVHKNCKQHHLTEHRRSQLAADSVNVSENATQQITVGPQFVQPMSESVLRNIDLWPPCSVGLGTNPNSNIANQFSSPNGLIPAVYYIPASQPNTSTQENRTPSAPYAAVQYMTGLVYPQRSMFGQHVFYPHPSFMYQTVSIPTMPSIPANMPSATNTASTVSEWSKFFIETRHTISLHFRKLRSQNPRAANTWKNQHFRVCIRLYWPRTIHRAVKNDQR